MRRWLSTFPKMAAHLLCAACGHDVPLDHGIGHKCPRCNATAWERMPPKFDMSLMDMLTPATRGKVLAWARANNQL